MTSKNKKVTALEEGGLIFDHDWTTEGSDSSGHHHEVNSKSDSD